MVAQDGKKEIVVNKSRFICQVKRVYNTQEALAFIKSVKKEHWNATHNCSAYQIGDFNEIQKANDDGEPSGTAGIPMLEILRKQGLKNCVVVVTRYFGGIKLGTGGLIRAYGHSVSETIKELGIVEQKTMKTVFIHTDYSLLATLQNRFSGTDYLIKDVHFTDRVTLEVIISIDAEDSFTNWITELTHGKANLEKGEISFQEITYLP